MWICKKHRVGNSYQEVKVSMIVQDIATYAGGWNVLFVNEFNRRIGELKSYNAFQVKDVYEAVTHSDNEVIVRKMKVNGDFNYRMFTLNWETNK